MNSAFYNTAGRQQNVAMIMTTEQLRICLQQRYALGVRPPAWAVRVARAATRAARGMGVSASRARAGGGRRCAVYSASCRRGAGGPFSRARCSRVRWCRPVTLPPPSVARFVPVSRYLLERVPGLCRALVQGVNLAWPCTVRTKRALAPNALFVRSPCRRAARVASTRTTWRGS